MLKIKKGAVIAPYGAASESFTDESQLSQPILEHLKTRFPDDIEDISKGKTKEAPAPVAAPETIDLVVTAETLEENPELVEEGVKEGEIVQVDATEVVEQTKEAPAPVAAKKAKK